MDPIRIAVPACGNSVAGILTTAGRVRSREHVVQLLKNGVISLDGTMLGHRHDTLMVTAGHTLACDGVQVETIPEGVRR